MYVQWHRNGYCFDNIWLLHVANSHRFVNSVTTCSLYNWLIYFNNRYLMIECSYNKIWFGVVVIKYYVWIKLFIHVNFDPLCWSSSEVSGDWSVLSVYYRSLVPTCWIPGPSFSQPIKLVSDPCFEFIGNICFKAFK